MTAAWMRKMFTVTQEASSTEQFPFGEYEDWR